MDIRTERHQRSMNQFMMRITDAVLIEMSPEEIRRRMSDIKVNQLDLDQLRREIEVTDHN